MAIYRFGGFSLDTKAHRLCRGRDAIDLSHRPLDLLAYLAARPAQLVTHAELFRSLWGDTAVTPNVLMQLVSDARRALDDSPSTPRYIETVARRGYRFIAAVEEIDGSQPPVASPAVASPQPPNGQLVQTSNMEVLRSIFDGRLKLESLGAAEVDAGIVHFGRAVQLDPAFAGGYVGLANAKFWKYELTRSGFQPDTALLAAAIQDARQAVLLASSLAEAHATLSYLLTASGRADDARTAAQRAVALQPEFWAHHFRLGHATWGDERLRALARCLELYPAFAFAHFEMAMVHIARGRLDVARGVLREGVAIEARHGEGAEGLQRFPANGLHWMLGAIALSHGDVATAVAECNAELAGAGRSLYAREFSAAALNTSGFALILGRTADRATDAGPDSQGGQNSKVDSAIDYAAEMFRQSLAINDQQVRPHIGLAHVARLRRRSDDTIQAIAMAQRGVTRLRCGGRSVEALTMEAALQLLENRQESALETLMRVLEEPSPQAGWSIPIDPLFASRRRLPAFENVSRRLAMRAE